MICVSVNRLSSESSAYVPSRIKKLLSFEVFFVVAIRIENQASKGGPRTAPGSVRDSDKISHSDWSCQTRAGTVSRCVTDEQALWFLGFVEHCSLSCFFVSGVWGRFVLFLFANSTVEV